MYKKIYIYDLNTFLSSIKRFYLFYYCKSFILYLSNIYVKIITNSSDHLHRHFILKFRGASTDDSVWRQLKYTFFHILYNVNI